MNTLEGFVDENIKVTSVKLLNRLKFHVQVMAISDSIKWIFTRNFAQSLVPKDNFI